MIPTFTHCQDCGTPPTPVTAPWGGSGYVAWWCRLCKRMLA